MIADHFIQSAWNLCNVSYELSTKIFTSYIRYEELVISINQPTKLAQSVQNNMLEYIKQYEEAWYSIHIKSIFYTRYSTEIFFYMMVSYLNVSSMRRVCDI